MSRTALIALIAFAALVVSSCSSSPEEALASDMCAVLIDYKDNPEEADIIATEQELGDLALRGRADGVDFDQVEAKLELDCTDAFAVYLNDQEEMLDLLDDISEDLQDFLDGLEG